MRSKLQTRLAYTRNFLTTGAFKETSENVEKEITKYIDDKRSKIVLEFGMGLGNITREILNNLGDDGQLVCFEINDKFCIHVDETIQDERLAIINDSAENFSNYIVGPVDNFISSLPFSLLTKDQTQRILQDSYHQMTENGYFSQVIYAKYNAKKFESVFDECTLFDLGNFPREYIYHCRKGGRDYE